jgi:hypothetical protein
MYTHRYDTVQEARSQRLYARRAIRQLGAQLPYHTSFLSRRRRITDRHRLSLMQLMVTLEATAASNVGPAVA